MQSPRTVRLLPPLSAREWASLARRHRRRLAIIRSRLNHIPPPRLDAWLAALILDLDAALARQPGPQGRGVIPDKERPE